MRTETAPPVPRPGARESAWLRRPKWLIALLAAVALLLWIGWPVPIYWVGTQTYLMVEGPADAQRLIGVVHVSTHSSPRRAREALLLTMKSGTVTRAAPEGAVWVEHDGRPRLCFLNSNLLVAIDDQNAGQPVPTGCGDWPGPGAARLEAVRKQIDGEIRAGSVGGRSIGRERIPRGLVWLFPDGCDRKGVEKRREELRDLLKGLFP